MSQQPIPQDQISRAAAAQRAVDDYVMSSQVVGLGTGSTAYWVIQKIGDKVATGELTNITCVCTSRDTEERARARGLRCVQVDELSSPPHIDVAIDGADEIWIDLSPSRNISLLKGRGAALYREKFIESIADKFICVADSSKLVPVLGQNYLPIEMIGSWNPKTTTLRVQACCQKFGNVISAVIRLQDGTPLITDNGNYIIDVTFESGISKDPLELHNSLKALNGVCDTGLFVGMNPQVILADQTGRSWKLQ